MELSIIVMLFVLSLGAILYGFIRRNFTVATVGCIFLIISGAILIVEGYDTYVQCDSSGNNCSERITLNLDANQNVVSIDQNLMKMNGARSRFSYSFGYGAIGLGCLLLMLGLGKRVEGM